MSSLSTFYLSRIIGNKVISDDKKIMGKLNDVIVDVTFVRPKIVALNIKIGKKYENICPESIKIFKEKGQYTIICSDSTETFSHNENTLFLSKNILDKQIVDMNGRKLERVNDIRLAILSSGIFVVAVDVGIDGLLRRLGVAKPIKKVTKPFGLTIPSRLILWDEVETIATSNLAIKLSKSESKLLTLHPSDLADIIEDLDRQTQATIFESLDEEKAADVLEELETDAQLSILKSLSKEKAADVLEKMPADEVADILDEMEDDKAEELLGEMDIEASDEVRELMEYPENLVGSIMTTDFISFNENMTVGETIEVLRKQKPESDTIYYLYILNNKGKLTATLALRDLIVSEPDTKLKSIMNKNIVYVKDSDKINSLADILSKYSLLALPVVDEKSKMLGVVIIDDVVHTLIKSRKR